jgi:hypothetical protein
MLGNKFMTSQNNARLFQSFLSPITLKRRLARVAATFKRLDKMTELYIKESRKSIYTGASAINCEECGEPIPEQRRKAIACKCCLPCQAALESKSR